MSPVRKLLSLATAVPMALAILTISELAQGKEVNKQTETPCARLLASPEAGLGGRLRAILKSGGNLQRLLGELHRQVGPFFSVKAAFMPDHLFFTSDPKTIHDIFNQTDRPDGSFTKDKRNILAVSSMAGANNLFTAPFETWKAQRQQLAPFFRAQEMRRPDYAALIEKFVTDKFSNLQPGQADYKQLIHETTLDVITRFLFNYQMKSDDLTTIAKDWQRVYQTVLIEAMNPLGQPIHDLPTVTEYQAAVKETLQTTGRVIEDILQRYDDDLAAASGLLAIMMKMRDPNRGPITRAEVRDQIFAFMEAGSESVAHVIVWAVHDILVNPDVQGKLVTLIHSGQTEAANEYINKIWEEALRLHMPLPLIPRQAVKDVVVSGAWGSYQIPKGATVVLDTGVMQRREDLFGVEKTGYPANEFHPEREVNGADFQTYAFGGGPRVCIGWMLGSLEARTIIYQLFKSFDVELSTPVPALKVTRLNDALVSPNEITLSPRK